MPGLLYGGVGLAKGRKSNRRTQRDRNASRSRDVPRSRNVPRSRDVPRSRNVPRSRDVPRNRDDSRERGSRERNSSGELRASRKGRGAPRKVTKIKKYRKPLNLNIGMLIFAVIFFYVVVCVILYFQTSHIVRYEVKEGSLATDTVYRGVALRDETVVRAETAGYVNYYAREGERVAKNNLVYIVDETGRLNEELENLSLGENSLSDRELMDFRSEIVNFVHGFRPEQCDSTYDFKYSMKNTVLKLANTNMLERHHGREHRQLLPCA